MNWLVAAAIVLLLFLAFKLARFVMRLLMLVVALGFLWWRYGAALGLPSF